MTNNRNISFGPGGTYNENIQVQGDFVQGDKIQSDKVISQDLNQAIINIQRLLCQLQQHYSLTEAQHIAATKLANHAKKSLNTKNTLTELGRYVAENGGIEAGIGKVIELALKLLGL